eukprot:6205998-Pleurochrysis_carterae.AAC.2
MIRFHRCGLHTQPATSECLGRASAESVRVRCPNLHHEVEDKCIRKNATLNSPSLLSSMTE